MTPKDLTPVIAEIKHLNDLGISKWYEVVYYSDGEWHAYDGSNTFKDGEKVLQWKYCDDVFNTKEKMVEDEIDYKKEYYRLYQEVAKMLVENRRNYETPMTPFELLSRWDKIREVKNTFNTNEK